ncbi:MAG TPA: transketolase [Candidatus Binataceae bacterium]|nr:transketolase [Candidatus Binataceae bacterium]
MALATNVGAAQLPQPDLDQLCVNSIRVLAIDAVQKANSGHPGMPMGTAPIGYLLFTRFMRHNPANPAWFGRDRFVLSAGHGSMLLYSLLYLSGYDLPLDEIKRFRQLGSRTPGHPEYHCVPGVETTTGPLGQGFATGVGMAIAARHMRALFERDGIGLFDHRIFAIASDGDMMEGVSSEAASLAGHLGLGNLVYLYDDNHITIDGHTDITFSEDVCKRFEAYGWHTQAVEDGNDLDALGVAIERACTEEQRPSLIRVRTHIGYGSPHRQDSAEAHGKALGVEEVKLTKQNYGWPLEPDFYVPDEALREFRKCRERGAAAEAAWNRKLDAYGAKYPAEAVQLGAMLAGRLPDGWDSDLPKFTPKDNLATRESASKAEAAIAKRVPALIGGAGDLNESTFTDIKDGGSFGARSYAGRNLHFGIREHAMCAALNGIALHGGLVPLGSTFLVFSDYARGSIRLAALMGAHVIYVFTHDSIGLGEDGHTHQPVEHLTALRAMPNLTVIRPADANEAVEAWRVAMQHREGPVLMALSRQKVPTLDREQMAPAAMLARGAYVLTETSDRKPDIILIATGSEVQLALGAKPVLEQRGFAVRVVSMPSFELFECQDAAYQRSLLPPEVQRRLAIEAGAPLCWYRWVGPQGDIIGMTSFGASAPYADAFKHFGFTVENVVARALSVLER